MGCEEKEAYYWSATFFLSATLDCFGAEDMSVVVNKTHDRNMR